MEVYFSFYMLKYQVRILMNLLVNLSCPASVKGAKAEGEEGKERVEEHVGR